MTWIQHKIKAASIQYVLVISVIILIVVSAFISLIYLQKRIAQKGALFKETIHHTNLAFNYTQYHEVPYDSKVELSFSDLDFEETNMQRKHWGIYDIVTVQAKIKNEIFQKTGILGGKVNSRKALHLQDTDKPLVLVGNANIRGDAALPKRGVKRGSIAGTSYYGTSLIYGNSQISGPSLPTIRNTSFLKSFMYTKNFENMQEFVLEDGLKQERSFNDPTLVYEQSEPIFLKGVSLKGNIVISSETAITIHPTTVLEHVIIMAPEINIQANTNGSFQALATQKIKVGKGCKLEYPSALVVLQKDLQNMDKQKEPSLEIFEKSSIDGVVLYQTDTNGFNYYTQLFIASNSVIKGEVYCEKNLELKGTVKGTVYTGNFIAREYGGVYVNHLYNGVINSQELPNQFAGLFVNTTKMAIAKWVY